MRFLLELDDPALTCGFLYRPLSSLSSSLLLSDCYWQFPIPAAQSEFWHVARALVQLHATADPLLPRVVLPSQQRGALSSAVHKRAKWSVLIAIPQSFTAPPSVIFLTLPPPLLRILSSSTISRSQHFNERRRYRHSTTATSDDIRADRATIRTTFSSTNKASHLGEGSAEPPSLYSAGANL